MARVFARGGGGYGCPVTESAVVTGGLMVVFVIAMVVAMLLDRRRVRDVRRDPSRVRPDLRRRARAGELRRHPEED